jgi:sigma-B regulation protein RsbU (phosphoserine phosphatase)
MEQQQFKVSVSLGTKFLLSIVLLLVVVIFSLNAATLVLMKEDKRAYIYSSQGKEALLAGKEFESLVRHSIDTLRLSLASIDPTKPPVLGPNKALDSVIHNQSDLLITSLYLWAAPNTPTETLTFVTESDRADDLAKDKIVASEYQLMPAQLIKVKAQLLKNSYAYLNLSKNGRPPMLGILFADINMRSNPQGMPIALGVAPLSGFARAMADANLSVTDGNGTILFDTDPSQLFGANFGAQSLIEDRLYGAARTSRVTDGSQEYEKNGIKYLGSYTNPGLDLLVFERTEWKKAIQSVYQLAQQFVFLAFMAVGAAVIFAIFFSKSLSAPIKRLYQATREVAKGNFNLNLKPSGRDEIGALTSSFNVMSVKISELIKESMEKVQLENELAIASTVQKTLIPPPDYKSDRILIRSHYQAATTCGGDWWGFFTVGDKFCVMIADATGHGFPSALITASARSCFSVLHKLAQQDPNFSYSPADMLSYANRVIYESSMAQIMMTFFVATIDFKTGVMKYASAGHNPPWLFRKDGQTFGLNSLVAEGTRLGEKQDAPPFEEKQIQVAQGDMLFLYTDGLTEGKNLAGDMYGKKKVRKKVEASLSGGPRNVVDELMKEFMAHNTGKPLDDDVTIAVATIGKVG